MKRRFVMIALMLFSVTVSPHGAHAWSPRAIDAKVDSALHSFKRTTGAEKLISDAAGVLVFPNVAKVGFVFGGEYGRGALRVDGRSEGYYSTAAASFGFQLGIQQKTIIIVFMEDYALENFRNSSGWQIGADASVALLTLGASGSIDSSRINEPIVAFVLDQKGLMYNVTLEGAKITKLSR